MKRRKQGNLKMSINRSAGILLLVASCAFPARAMPVIQAVEDMRAGATETLTLTFNEPVKHKKFFRLGNPFRLVLDMPTTDGSRLHFAPAETNGLIQSLRFGQNTPDTSRLVVNLTNEAGQVSAVDSDNRIVLTIATRDGAPLPALAPAPPSARPAELPVPPMSVQHTVLETRRGGRSSLNGGHSVTIKTDEPAKNPSVSPVHAAPNPAPISKLPLIVIDAGHGGKDPGTEGVRQSHEKDLTLRYARIVRDSLQKSGRYRVLLTRSDDRFILLGERVRIGEKAGANLFISLHADSAMGTGARGLSVYTVSETASDATAAALADKENSADILAGFKVDVADEEAAGILLELAQRDTKNKGSDFADRLVSSMGKENIRLLPSPHRFAGFRVLKAPDVPSVLIETGFLSNEADEAQLQSEAYPKKVAAGILNGLDSYFAKHPVK